MRKINRLPYTTLMKFVFTPFLFLLTISCGKELSREGAPSLGTVSIFTDQIPDGQPRNDYRGVIQLGLKVRADVSGYAYGIRFYKIPGDSGTHTAQLYTPDGTLLASQVFLNETDSGWQTAVFETPVPIAAATTYIAAYHSILGNYISSVSGMTTAITNGPLTALADSTDGENGLFKYTDTPGLPDRGYLASNYWVDVIERLR